MSPGQVLPPNGLKIKLGFHRFFGFGNCRSEMVCACRMYLLHLQSHLGHFHRDFVILWVCLLAVRGGKNEASWNAGFVGRPGSTGRASSGTVAWKVCVLVLSQQTLLLRKGFLTSLSLNVFIYKLCVIPTNSEVFL